MVSEKGSSPSIIQSEIIEDSPVVPLTKNMKLRQSLSISQVLALWLSVPNDSVYTDNEEDLEYGDEDDDEDEDEVEGEEPALVPISRRAANKASSDELPCPFVRRDSTLKLKERQQAIWFLQRAMSILQGICTGKINFMVVKVIFCIILVLLISALAFSLWKRISVWLWPASSDSDSDPCQYHSADSDEDVVTVIDITNRNSGVRIYKAMSREIKMMPE